jgi:hypothetical protein
MAFASVPADHSSHGALSKRVVSAQLMPIIGSIELRDLLTQLTDALTVRGVIMPEPASPTVFVPPGRPH